MKKILQKFAGICLIALTQQTAFADQCIAVSEPQAKAAAKLLQNAQFLDFCEPCGDKTVSVVKAVESVRVADFDAKSKKVVLNGRDVDLAYIFVKSADGTELINVGSASGCPVEGVSSRLKVPSAAGSGFVRKVVTVDGRNDEWTNSKLKLEAGDLVFFLASGQAKVGDWIGATTPAGNIRLTSAGFLTGDGTLVRQVGTGGAKPVGSRNWLIATESEKGALKLKVHDTAYANNSGAYAVDTLLVPAGMLPTPVSIVEDSAPPTVAAINRVTIRVEGTNDEWVNTLLKLESGDVVLARAAGTVNGVGPAGSNRALGLATGICLAMKVGTGTAQYAGDWLAFAAKDPGALKFRVNSKSFDSNKGAFDVEVFVVRSNSLPIPEAVHGE